MSKLLDPAIRTNATGWLIWRLRNGKELFDNVLREQSLNYPVKTLQAMYERATAEPYSFWYINNQAKSKEDQFWKNFQTRLVPASSADPATEKDATEETEAAAASEDVPALVHGGRESAPAAGERPQVSETGPNHTDVLAQAIALAGGPDDFVHDNVKNSTVDQVFSEIGRRPWTSRTPVDLFLMSQQAIAQQNRETRQAKAQRSWRQGNTGRKPM